MQTKILIGIISVFFTGTTVFAQQNTESTNAKKDIYVPGMTKEEKAEKAYQESLKQVEIKKSNIPADEKKDFAPVEISPVKINENVTPIEREQNDIKLLIVEPKEAVINRSEIEKVRVIESEKPDKK